MTKVTNDMPIFARNAAHGAVRLLVHPSTTWAEYRSGFTTIHFANGTHVTFRFYGTDVLWLRSSTRPSN